jgi:hypothetical protein
VRWRAKGEEEDDSQDIARDDVVCRGGVKSRRLPRTGLDGQFSRSNIEILK